MSEYIKKKKEEAREFIKKNAMGLVCPCGGGGTDEKNEICKTCGGCGIYDWRIHNIDTLIETTIKDTLQTLLDSEEMKEEPVYSIEEEDLNFMLLGKNEAITAIRNKITSMLDNQQ